MRNFLLGTSVNWRQVQQVEKHVSDCHSVTKS